VHALEAQLLAVAGAGQAAPHAGLSTPKAPRPARAYGAV
jgi:hypothetical protein